MDIHGHTSDGVGLWVRPEKPHDEIQSQLVSTFVIAARAIINVIIVSRVIINIIIAFRTNKYYHLTPFL
jgi:hypothetical protein